RPVKRVADVVRAFSQICEKLPARLLLLGDGPDREHALAVAADLGCSHRVEHLGMRDNLQELLPQADLFLSASQTESFGLSILEAMSCGVPCVSSDVGGVAEVVADTGKLVPLGDPSAMARAAIDVLSDANAYERLAKAARRRAIEHFATDRIVTQYESLYERVIR
ncbi:MAG: glycosyltransferase, partial [Planctomycetes bacterium]|nr:glycosyltransferase [Planctomycetota bacterium]